MHYLVDAYNLLFRSLKKKDSLEKTRRGLIEELNDAVAQLNLQVTLVFDGAEEHPAYPVRGHFDALEIVYTPKRLTADEYIFDEVRHSRTPAQITVVTRDRELAGRCRAQRAKILTNEQFLALLLKKKKKKTSPKSKIVFRDSDPEILRLLHIFEKKLLENLTKEWD